jgi:hypothetical protein
MRIAADMSDSPRGATLFARIPLPMDEREASAAFERPLGEWLAAQGIAFSIRCFVLDATADGPSGVGVEVQLDSADPLWLIVQQLAELGAPPETVIEIESDKACMETSLAELGL